MNFCLAWLLGCWVEYNLITKLNKINTIKCFGPIFDTLEQTRHSVKGL